MTKEEKAEDFKMRLAMREIQRRVFVEVGEERSRQDQQWGGVEHDVSHDAQDWSNYIDHQLQVCRTTNSDREFRRRLIKIAALAVAAVESMDAVSLEII